MINQIRNKESF